MTHPRLVIYNPDSSPEIIEPDRWCATINKLLSDLHRVWRAEKEAEEERVRCMSRCAVIKEELLANRYAPERVERLLAQGLELEEALEMLGLGAE